MLRRRAGKDDAAPGDKKDSKGRPLLNRLKTEEDKLREEFGGAKVKQLVIRPRSKRRNGFIFVLGGLFGVLVALFFANQQEVISLESLMDLNLESLIDVMPQGIVRDAKAFSVSGSPAFKGLLWLLRGRHICWIALIICGSSNVSVMQSATILLPSACTFSPKGSAPNIQW